MIKQTLNKEVINAFTVTHKEVVSYFKYTFPPLFAVNIHKGNCSLTFTDNSLLKLSFTNVDLFDTFLIVKALGYNVEYNNTTLPSFTIRF